MNEEQFKLLEERVVKLEDQVKENELYLARFDERQVGISSRLASLCVKLHNQMVESDKKYASKDAHRITLSLVLSGIASIVGGAVAYILSGKA